MRATYGYFIDQYVVRSSFTEQAYKTETAEDHTYTKKFTSENLAAGDKFVLHAQQNNRRLDFIALKNHYKGFGVHAINIFQAGKVLQYLFYVDEKIYICGGMYLKGILRIQLIHTLYMRVVTSIQTTRKFIF